MSRLFLKKLLDAEINSIKKSSEIYRFQSDQEVHEFIISKKSIAEQVRIELNKRNITISSPIDSIINTYADKILNAVLNYFSNNNRLYEGERPKVSFESDELSIIVYSPISELIWVPNRKRGKRKGWIKTKATIFDTISNSYKRQRADLVNALNLQLSIENVGNPQKISGQFLAVGHLQESSIIEKRISKSKKSLGRITRKRNLESKDKITPEDIKTLFGDDIFELSQVSNKSKTTVKASIESATANSLKGSKEEKSLKQEYIRLLENALIKLDNEKSFADREGSDSRITIEKKKIVKSFVNSIKKSKNITVESSINLTPKYSNSKVKQSVKKKKPNIKKKVSEKISAKPVGNIEIQKISKKPTLNLNALKAQINARLSMTVIKNMGTPALENRTGRFARSVQVTDVVQTSKGFPSIGYTYQKYPYQTFEPGFKQGSAQRDPRTLIDRSIREIASELLVGRFYTRRV